MTSIQIDTSELRSFSVDLGHASAKVQDGTRGLVEGAIKDITHTLRDDMGASPSFGALAGGIASEMDADGLGAVTGPTKAHRGGLSKLGTGANIAYFGGANGGGGTIADPMGALETEAPRFQRAIADLARDLLR